jgi:hypothetical protein
MNDFLPSLFFDVEPTTVDTLREELRDNMEMLKLQTVEEHTLYKKWQEIHPPEFRKFRNRSEVVKAKIWVPTDLNDKEQTIREIEALRPILVYAGPEVDPHHADDWYMLRVFCSSARFDQNPGRMLKFTLQDEVTGKYLGVASIASEVISITVRDKWIGWTKEARLDRGRLKCSAIGTTIVPMQPLGYNMLGGKLTAAMLSTKIVRDMWEHVTGEPLAGLTTTSLYGISSMYNGIPYWKTLGETAGKIYLKPDDGIYEQWHHWLKKNHLEEYKKATEKEGINGPATGIKQKILDLIFRYASLKASRYAHGFSRGVFYAPLYINTCEFLRGEIEKDKLVLGERVAKDVEGVVSWWKPKAIRRYEKLHEEGRLKPDILYYNELMDMEWEEVKDHYLEEVGR